MSARRVDTAVRDTEIVDRLQPLAMHLAIVATGIVLAAQVSAAAAQATDIKWVRITAGTFEMGCVPEDTDCSDDERPRHRVTLAAPFDLMATEATIGMFRAFAAAGTSAMPEQPSWNRGDRLPVINVTWDEADAFCRRAGGRLPT